jgi:hypothetical protein
MGITRFFVLKSNDGNVLEVYRTEWEGIHITEQSVWSRQDRAWLKTTNVADALITGDMNIDEVMLEDVAPLLPETALGKSVTKAGVPSILEVERALSRLEILPNPYEVSVDDAHDLVKSPWAVRSAPTVDPLTWDGAVLETIKISDLFATDPFLNKKNVREQIAKINQDQNLLKTYPLVYEINNEPLIIDGHHRLMAMELLGLDQAPVWIVKE